MRIIASIVAALSLIATPALADGPPGIPFGYLGKAGGVSQLGRFGRLLPSQAPVTVTQRAPGASDDQSAGFFSTDGVNAYVVGSGGSGYTSPTLTFSGCTTSPTAQITLNSGVVTWISPLTPGAGCVNPTATISDPAGTGATVTLLGNPAPSFWGYQGQLYQPNQTATGSGAWQAATAGAGLPCDAASGVLACYGARVLRAAYIVGVTGYTVTAGGSGYVAPTATVSGCIVAPTAGVILSSGTVSALYYKTPGYGCSNPAVTITDGSGTGAAVTPMTGFASAPAFDVVRASDSAQATINFRSDGTADYAALDLFCLGTTCRIATWYDQQSGFNATQSTAANQPAIVASNVIGNARDIVLDSQLQGTVSNRYLNLPSSVTASSNALSVVMLARARHSYKPMTFVQMLGTTNVNWGFFGTGVPAGFVGASLTIPFKSAFRPSQTPFVAGFDLSSAAGGSDLFGAETDVPYGLVAGVTEAGGTIGYSTTGPAGSGYFELGAMIFYSRPITSPDRSNVRSALYSSFGLQPQARDVFVTDGDSITEGFGSTLHQNYPRQVEPILNHPFRIYDVGIFGDTVVQQAANFPKAAAPLFNWSPNAQNVLSIFAGTNDINGGSTDVQTESALTAYVQQARAMAPAGTKVICGTTLPRNTFSPQQETYRQNYNAFIRSGGPGCDAVADFAADPIMGNPSNVTNTAYFVDGTHPTSLGYSLLAPILAKQANALLQ
jgi:lysophospholipase L1-like esterase